MGRKILAGILLIATTAAVYAGIVAAIPGAISTITLADSGVPAVINHQGAVLVDGVRFTGTGGFRFAIMNVTTGATLWSNSAPGGDQIPTAAVSLPVADGVYSVKLGDTALPNMAALNPAIFSNGNTALRVWFDDGPPGNHGIQQLSPDHKLTSIPYAMAIADGAVTASKLGSDVFTVPQGGIIMWSGSTASIPAGWQLCDGTNGTPDLRGRFVVGAGGSYAVGSAGGSDTTIVPGHKHSKGTLVTDTYVGGSTDILRWTNGPPGDRTAPTGQDFRGGLSVNHSHQITGTVGNTASSHNGDNNISIENRPPYYALCYIMKL